MAYDLQLAASVREYLARFPELQVEEKKMFRGLAFMINNKLCVCVSGENLMCRFDPAMHGQLTGKPGIEPMIMKGKVLQGYCYVTPAGLPLKTELAEWMDRCLAFNNKAKASKKKKQKSNT